MQCILVERKGLIVLKAFIFKRVAALVPILLIASIIIFSIIHLIPGDPALVMLGNTATKEQVAELRNELGLNDPIVEQYFQWVVGVFQGDLGNSYFFHEPVGGTIISHLGPTLSLAILAQILAIVIGIPIGIIAATRRGSVQDQSLMVVSLLGISIPGFLIALLLILLFAVKLRWFPVAGYQPLSTGFWTYLKFLILPVISLGSIQVAMIARMTRSSVLEVLNADFIKASRSKGVKEWNVIYKHALRNSFLPIITVIGQTFGVMVTGAVVIETIFNIPGIGQLIINSIERRDYAVIQGVVLFATLTYVLINLFIDLLYGIIDPRIRLGQK